MGTLRDFWEEGKDNDLFRFFKKKVQKKTMDNRHRFSKLEHKSAF